MASAAGVLTKSEFSAFDAAAFCDRGAYAIPAEHKADSFGWRRGEVVAIDYGGWARAG